MALGSTSKNPSDRYWRAASKD